MFPLILYIQLNKKKNLVLNKNIYKPNTKTNPCVSKKPRFTSINQDCYRLNRDPIHEVLLSETNQSQKLTLHCTSSADN